MLTLTSHYTATNAKHHRYAALNPGNWPGNAGRTADGTGREQDLATGRDAGPADGPAEGPARAWRDGAKGPADGPVGLADGARGRGTAGMKTGARSEAPYRRPRQTRGQPTAQKSFRFRHRSPEPNTGGKRLTWDG